MATRECRCKIIFILLVSINTSNGMMVSFFKYADKKYPHFYLTMEEYDEAIKDPKWKKEAEQFNFRDMISAHSVEIPALTEGGPTQQGLEMDAFKLSLANFGIFSMITNIL